MIHGVFVEDAMFFRLKKSGDKTYFQIVENRWEDGRSKQTRYLYSWGDSMNWKPQASLTD